MNPRGRVSASDRRRQQRYQTIQDRRERQKTLADVYMRYEEQEPARVKDEDIAWVVEYLRSKTERAWTRGRGSSKSIFCDEFAGHYADAFQPTPVDLKDDFESWDVSQISDFYSTFQE